MKKIITLEYLILIVMKLDKQCKKEIAIKF